MQITSGDMPMLSDLQLVYMVPRNSTELLKINTTKFQVEREPVYTIGSRAQSGTDVRPTKFNIYLTFNIS